MHLQYIFCSKRIISIWSHLKLLTFIFYQNLIIALKHNFCKWKYHLDPDSEQQESLKITLTGRKQEMFIFIKITVGVFFSRLTTYYNYNLLKNYRENFAMVDFLYFLGFLYVLFKKCYFASIPVISPFLSITPLVVSSCFPMYNILSHLPQSLYSLSKWL